MKDKPFQAGDLEAAVHGGGHVHGHGDDKEEVPVVGVHEIDEVKDMLHHKEKEEEVRPCLLMFTFMLFCS